MSIIKPSIVPQAPRTIEQTGLDAHLLIDLALRCVYTDPSCTTERLAATMKISHSIADIVLQELYRDHMIENRGQVNFGNNRYAMLEKGWQRAQHLMALNGYVGPAPVPLEDYCNMVTKQSAQRLNVSPADVQEATKDVVLPDQARRVLGLVVSSRRSLFLTGPAGNGKTTVALALHNAQKGDIWIPYAIEVDGHVIKLYDQHNHQLAETDGLGGHDERWVKIKRPMIVVGGEMTIETMDLIYSPTVHYYEAPFQLKSNGGTLLIDDFGRQRIDPTDLLNRWITPLEGKVDYLTLHTGKKIAVPFEQLLIFSTNLNPKDLVDQAFLRRMGYRLFINPPDVETYKSIFWNVCRKHEFKANESVLSYLFHLYEVSKRDLRGCEPRDLITRCVDYCEYEGKPRVLTDELLQLAWDSYFGLEGDMGV